MLLPHSGDRAFLRNFWATVAVYETIVRQSCIGEKGHFSGYFLL